MPIIFGAVPGLEIRTADATGDNLAMRAHSQVVMVGRSAYIPLYAITKYTSYTDFLAAVGGSATTPSIDWYMDNFAYNFFRFGGVELTFLNSAYASSDTTNTVDPLNDPVDLKPLITWTFASDYMKRVMGVLSEQPPSIVVMPVFHAMLTTTMLNLAWTMATQWEAEVAKLPFTRHILFWSAPMDVRIAAALTSGTYSTGAVYTSVSAAADADYIISRTTAAMPVQSQYGTTFVCSGWGDLGTATSTSTRAYHSRIVPPVVIFSVVAQLRNLKEIAAPPAGTDHVFYVPTVYPPLTSASLTALNNKHINSIKSLGGANSNKVVAWGARTRNTGAYRFATAAFVTNLLIYTLARNIAKYVFTSNVNTNLTLASISQAITRVMATFYKAELLYGATEGDAFAVIVDATNNPPEQIEQGNVYAVVRYVPSPTTEKIFLSAQVSTASELAQIRSFIGGERTALTDISSAPTLGEADVINTNQQ